MPQVRLFAYSGTRPISLGSDAGQHVTNTGFIYKEPYLARENLAIDTGTAVASAAALSGNTNAKQQLLRVQVDPGARTHYELTPNGQTARTADTSSPIITDDDNLEWGPGWTISLLQTSS